MSSSIMSIAPGWFIVALLALLAIALLYTFAGGADLDEMANTILDDDDEDDVLQDGHVHVRPHPYDQALEEEDDDA